LNQDRFILDEFLLFRLAQASAAVSQMISESLAERFGLTISEWKVIILLAERGASPQCSLVRPVAMDKVQLSRTVQNLVKRRLVRRFPLERDRRSHHLTVSELGFELYRHVLPEAIRHQCAIIDNLTCDEHANLNWMLQRMKLNAERAMEGTCAQRERRTDALASVLTIAQ
jgi:DNA-binding MarR family transcriptional regulator